MSCCYILKVSFSDGDKYEGEMYSNVLKLLNSDDIYGDFVGRSSVGLESSVLDLKETFEFWGWIQGLFAGIRAS